MRITRFFLPLIALLILAVGCNTPNSGTTDTTDGTPVTGTDMDDDDGMAAGGDNYTITTLDTTIKSPRKELRGNIDGVDVVVNYGSPSVNNRNIYGELVPFGKVWRTGANEATRITFGSDVMVGEDGTMLEAGTYSLFTMPQDREDWTVIFNKTPDQWGAYDYDETQDAVRIEGNARQISNRAEMMDFALTDNEVALMWDDLMVSFPVAPVAR